jgi:hypothetical protein
MPSEEIMSDLPPHVHCWACSREIPVIKDEMIAMQHVLQPAPQSNGQLAFVPRPVPICEICVVATEKAAAEAAKSRLIIPQPMRPV